jgi:hypothetical protein
MQREKKQKRKHVPDPVEYLCGGVGLHVLACGHHDEADGHERDHDSETLRSAPDVENLGEGKLEETSDNVGHDVGSGSERMLVEAASNIRRELEAHPLLHRVDEGDHPDPAGRSTC